jgi:hypothetical protein
MQRNYLFHNSCSPSVLYSRFRYGSNSFADPHRDADPDPAFHSDADPDPDTNFYSDADPDPGPIFQFDADVDPNPSTHISPDLDPPMLKNGPPRIPSFHFDADPDTAFHFDADPDSDPASKNAADSSGSATVGSNTRVSPYRPPNLFLQSTDVCGRLTTCNLRRTG